jgi:hypothetical protein
MNILVIGNGFDKQFGLPTSFEDFFYVIKSIITNENISSFKTFNEWSELNPEDFKTIKDKLQNNLWANYFVKINEDEKDVSPLWKDFESEIKYIINYIDTYYVTFFDRRNDFNGYDEDYPPEHFSFFGEHWDDSESVNMRKTVLFGETIHKTFCTGIHGKYRDVDAMMVDKSKAIDLIYLHLVEFVEMFERYCINCVDKIEVYEKSFILYEFIESSSIKSEAIKEHFKKALPLWGFDKILTFNYTNTYQRIYVDDTRLTEAMTCVPKDEQTNPEICYVHGKAGDGNIIMGIGEYLSEEEKNTNFDFIEFKKYYQRIDKKTGSAYKDWLKNDEPKNVYFLGHSFAETDHDILREFLTNDHCYNTILYHTPERKKELIQATINIIGQDELIKRVHGSNPHIRFEPQKDFLFSKDNTVFTKALRPNKELIASAK